MGNRIKMLPSFVETFANDRVRVLSRSRGSARLTVPPLLANNQ
jgi:hypothetical protein